MFKIIHPFLSATAAAAADAAGTPAGTDAATQPAGLGGLLSPILMIVVFGLLMYFMLFRPQKKQEKAVADMRNSLRVGDEISTTGGVLGKIIQIKDDFLVIETGNDKTKLKVAKWAVRAVEKRAEEEDDEEEE